MTHENKNAVAFVIYDEDRNKFLLVQRPADDDDFSNAWGLPAGLLKDGETYAQAVVRSGRDKLGVPAAQKGSLCCQLYLKSVGMEW